MISAAASERRTPEGLLLGMDALKEETRLRLLRLLERHELGVAPLCEVLQLPQSTVSRHLKVLSDLGYVQSRAQGTNRLYRMTRLDRDSAERRLWLLVRGETEGWPTARHDDLRLGRVLASQEPAAQAFFAGAVGQWDRLREEAYGRSLDRTAFLALLPADWTVADLGCGTGGLAVSLAPHVRKVVGVDQSAAMLRAARARTTSFDNVELRKGSLEDLPIEAGSCDAALLVLALSYVTEPTRALHEMTRILRPAGRAVVLDVLCHDREDFQRTMGQAVPGFEAEALREMMGDAGLQVGSCRPLAPEPGAKGPALVLATAERRKLSPRAVS
jgi:SAM-dependent methyltransferase